MTKILSFLAPMMLLSSMTYANVSVHDNAGVISQIQQNALVSNGSRWPFDLHVLTGAFPSPAALDNTVHRCVTGPNVVCVGIDPVHHKTNVHVGTGVGIPSSEFQAIAAAGNSSFKSGDYQGGIEAIASRARDSAHTVVNAVPVRNVSPVYTAQPSVQVHIDNPVSTGMSTGWWLFLFFMVVLVGVVIYYLRRAVKTAKKVNEDMNDFRDEAFEMSSRNIEQGEFHEKLKAQLGTKKPMTLDNLAVGYPHPAGTLPAAKVVVQPVVVANPNPVVIGSTPTVVHNHYGTPGYVGPSTGDMLLAYELGRVSNPTPVVVVHDTPAQVDKGGSSSNWDTKSDDNDSGGSSSSYDNNDSGSSSSNWDSGSSSSDSGSSSWDSGSSDSGSSGGDSGGGDSGW